MVSLTETPELSIRHSPGITGAGIADPAGTDLETIHISAWRCVSLQRSGIQVAVRLHAPIWQMQEPVQDVHTMLLWSCLLILCKEYGLNPMKDGVILSHAEGNARGIATNHGDPEHLWRGLALPYTMNTFRKAVKLKMEGKTGTVQEPAKADTDQKARHPEAGCKEILPGAEILGRCCQSVRGF